MVFEWYLNAIFVRFSQTTTVCCQSSATEVIASLTIVRHIKSGHVLILGGLPSMVQEYPEHHSAPPLDAVCMNESRICHVRAAFVSMNSRTLANSSTLIHVTENE